MLEQGQEENTKNRLRNEGEQEKETIRQDVEREGEQERKLLDADEDKREQTRNEKNRIKKGCFT